VDLSGFEDIPKRGELHIHGASPGSLLEAAGLVVLDPSLADLAERDPPQVTADVAEAPEFDLLGAGRFPI